VEKLVLQEVIRDKDTAYRVKIGSYRQMVIVCNEDESSVWMSDNGIDDVEIICSAIWQEVSPASFIPFGRCFHAVCDQKSPGKIIFAENEEHVASIKYEIPRKLASYKKQTTNIIMNRHLSSEEQANLLIEKMKKIKELVDNSDSDVADWIDFYSQLVDRIKYIGFSVFLDSGLPKTLSK
jgi:hypothetical protein